MQCNVTTGNRADMSLSCNTLQQNNNHTASLLYVSVMKECNIFWHGLYIFACSLSNSFGLTKALNCSTSSDVMLTWQFDKHQHLEITPCIATPHILHSQTAWKSFLSCQTAHSTETVSTIQTFIKSCLLPLCHLKNLLEYIPKTHPKISRQVCEKPRPPRQVELDQDLGHWPFINKPSDLRDECWWWRRSPVESFQKTSNKHFINHLQEWNDMKTSHYINMDLLFLLPAEIAGIFFAVPQKIGSYRNKLHLFLCLNRGFPKFTHLSILS